MSAMQQMGFSDLIAPLTPADLSAQWLSRAFRLQPSTGENRFTALLDWNALWTLIEEGILPPGECRITYGRRLVPPLFYADGGKINPARLARLFDQNASLIALKIEPYLPALAAACRNAATYGIRIAFAGVIVTMRGGGAFETHYDPHDLIILQVEGSKRWRIYGPRVLNPVPAPASADEIPPTTPPVLDIFLRPGDLLFLPAGFWHVCDNGPERSIHLGLFLNPPKTA